MRSYDLAKLVIALLSNDESLSLPFLKKKGDGLTLGFFTFGEKLYMEEGAIRLEREILYVNEILAVDPILTSVKRTECMGLKGVPCWYNPLGQCTKEEYEDVYFEYCKAIDEVLTGEDSIEKYKDLAKRIVPKQLTTAYKSCGAQFID